MMVLTQNEGNGHGHVWTRRNGLRDNHINLNNKARANTG